MKKRSLTSVFIVSITALAVLSKLLPYNIGTYVFDTFVLVIMCVAGFEMANIQERMDKAVDKAMVTMYGVYNIAIIVTFDSIRKFTIVDIVAIELLALLVYFLVIYLVDGFKHGFSKKNLKVSYFTISSCIYPGFLLSMLAILNHMDAYSIQYFSLIFIIMIFAITMLTDTFAYLVGSLIKGPKLAPKISPNKTVSGAIGGLVGGIAGAMIVFGIAKAIGSWTAVLEMYNLTWWKFLLIGLFGSLFGQIGDLFESKMKRLANIKDSGNIFPGHGGMFDRVDALTFVSLLVTLILITIIG